MSLYISARRARLLALRDALDAAGGGAVHVYSSFQPTTGGVSTEPAMLIAGLGVPSFALHPTDASMSLEAEGNIAVGGAPVWALFVDGAGTPVLDLTAGLPGSGAQLIISDGQPVPGNNFFVGGIVTFNVTLSEPE